MSEIEEALKRELTRLEARVLLVRELLTSYRDETAPTSTARPNERSAIKQPRAGELLERLGETKKSRINSAIEELIRKNGPMHRKVILDHLIDSGLMGTEKNPMQSLAIYLSGAGRFKSIADGVWALIDDKTETPASKPEGGSLLSN